MGSAGRSGWQSTQVHDAQAHTASQPHKIAWQTPNLTSPAIRCLSPWWTMVTFLSLPDEAPRKGAFPKCSTGADSPGKFHPAKPKR